MAKAKSAKIYVRVEDRLYDFMWANVMADESVVMGLRFERQQQIELVVERDEQWRPPQIEAPRIVCHPKINFHPSGRYKLNAMVGLTPGSVDRSTVTYQRLLELARQQLSAGWSTIVDAAFLKRQDRATFQALALAVGADFFILAPQATLAQLRERVLARGKKGNDGSEATLAVLDRQMTWIETLDAQESAHLLALKPP